jgi:hypothetical protein
MPANPQPRLAEDRRGIAAMEFCMAVPVLLLLFLGFADVVQIGRGHLRAQSTATQIGQIVSQCKRVSAGDETELMGLAQRILGSFGSGGKEWAVRINVFGRDGSDRPFSWATPMRGGAGEVSTTRSKGTAVPDDLTLKAGEVLFRTEVFVDVDTMFFSKKSPFLLGQLGPRTDTSLTYGNAVHMSREANTGDLREKRSGAADCMTARAS